MTQPIPGFSTPSASFEVPLEMLAACHARIEHQCSTLRRLVPHLADHGADADARNAAAAVIRYFDMAAKDHHADEEADLFPALIESMAGSDAVCVRELTETLSAQHRELETRWQRLRSVLEPIAAGQNVPLPGADVEAFALAYEQHLAREERELLPLAARLLSDADLDRIGRAMRLRRGVS